MLCHKTRLVVEEAAEDSSLDWQILVRCRQNLKKCWMTLSFLQRISFYSSHLFSQILKEVGGGERRNQYISIRHDFLSRILCRTLFLQHDTPHFTFSIHKFFRREEAIVKKRRLWDEGNKRTSKETWKRKLISPGSKKEAQLFFWSWIIFSH